MNETPETPESPGSNWPVRPDEHTTVSVWPELAEPKPIPFIYRQGISPGAFVFLCLAIVFITYQIIGGLIEILIYGVDLSPVHSTGFRVLTGASQIAFILVPTLFLVRGVTFIPAEYLRLKAPRWAAILPALVGVFSLQEVLQIVQSYIDKIPLPDRLEKFIEPIKQLITDAYKMLVTAGSVHELLLVLLIVAVIPAVCEEFLFRGLVQRTLESSMGVWKGVIITGLLFGAYHLDPFEFVPLASLGIYLGFLAMRAESLWMSATAHFFNNFLAVVVTYFHWDEAAGATGNPDLMTGPQNAVIFALFGLIFAASIYFFLLLTKPEHDHEVQPAS